MGFAERGRRRRQCGVEDERGKKGGPVGNDESLYSRARDREKGLTLCGPAT